MRSCCALGLVFALAATGQTRVSLRLSPNGGSATYTPMESIRPPVSGAPVSYELREVRVQTLADGTHVTQITRLERFWRDSQGRTRVERSYATPAIIFTPAGAGNALTPAWPTAEVADPAAGFWYLLESEKKIAHRGRLPMPTPAPPPPPSAVSEDLGTRTINGVGAQGSRSTVTTPVNGQGNDRPLPTTTETWTSPELQIMMLRKIHDPRTGDTTTELEDLSRAEPDAGLFAPPADYRVMDEASQFTVTWGMVPAPVPAPNAPAPAGAYRIGGGVSPPVPIYQPEPRYTEEARQAKIQGAVLLSIVVDQDGKAQGIRVVRPLDPGLDQMAIEAVSQRRFQPGQKDGKPVPVVASVEVNFRLLDRPNQ